VSAQLCVCVRVCVCRQQLLCTQSYIYGITSSLTQSLTHSHAAGFVAPPAVESVESVECVVLTVWGDTEEQQRPHSRH
jgi:hypothetical protein